MMTESNSFEDTTELVAAFLDDFSDSVELYEFDTEAPEKDVESERRRLIRVTEPVGPEYTVVATEESRYFRLQSQYELWRDVANVLSQDSIDEYVSDVIEDSHPVRSIVPGFDELEQTEQRRFAASMEILDSIPSESRRNIILQLTEVFTRAGLKHSVGAVREGSGITSFTVFHRIFPYEEEFSISQLNEAVERVRMTAHMAELLLKYTYNLPVDITGSESGDVTDPGRLPTQTTRTVDLGSEVEELHRDRSE